MRNYKIAVAGTGYVGLSLGVLLSQHHQVVTVDIVQAKVDIKNIMEMRWQRNEMGQLYKVDFQQDRRRKSVQYDCGTE